MQKMPPVIFTGTVFGLLQSFGLTTLNCICMQYIARWIPNKARYISSLEGDSSTDELFWSAETILWKQVKTGATGPTVFWFLCLSLSLGR